MKMSASVKVCDIDPVVLEKVKKFRFRKEKTIAAIVLKVQSDVMKIVVDEEYEDITFDDLVAELPDTQPRFIVLSYVLNHDDGRTTYPLCLIFLSPPGVSPDLQMMYTGTKLSLVKSIDATKIYDVREIEELTEEWLLEKLLARC